VLYAFRHPHLLGQRYPLTEEVTRIGRGSNNHIMLHSDTISREHARLERDGGKFVLVDQKSTNGTFVNDLPEPIHRHVLGDGDRLALGDTIVCFLSGDDLEAKYRAAIDHISQHDALTGVYNRHNWLAETERQVLYARGDDRPLCAVMLHIDQLESLKQKLSSLAVNAALLRVAQVLRRTLNDRAIMGRYSNDRFCLALPGFDSNRAMDSAERLRAELCSRPLTLAGETLELTVSVGVATLYRTTGTEELVEDCVAALERASRAGGNTVRGPRETAV
jgi:diguanylate cyclase (GGDEF)-like protein